MVLINLSSYDRMALQESLPYHQNIGPFSPRGGVI